MVIAEDSRGAGEGLAFGAAVGEHRGMSAEGRLPSRPRLAAHVLARRHVIDGQERVILHDQQRDGVLQIGAREWAVLEAADGTRDCEGIVVAARREGAHARVEAVRELLLALEEQGMLAAGEEA
jgi:lysine-N-methylase